MSSTRAADLVSKLALQPHPEGGWYREIYRSPTRVETARGSRSALTTIYYLLEQSQLSRWHVVQADELWHFYAGSPLELLAYTPSNRKFERSVLDYESAIEPVGRVGGGAATVAVADMATGAGRSAGADMAGATSVSVIPTGVWQAARTLGEYSLVGCTVGPGFEFADFQFVSALPAHADHFKGDLAAFANLL
jgi:predicted cupin superfamily sugar epimerase